MAVKICGCGCGNTTGAKFAVGHDSKFVSAKIEMVLQTNGDVDAAATEIETVGSAALAAKFRRNLQRALDRRSLASQPKTRTSHATAKSEQLKAERDAKSRTRAEALIDRLASDYWTGQEGVIREAGGVEIPARVVKRLEDGMLLVRLRLGLNTQDRPVNRDHFFRPNLLTEDD